MANWSTFASEAPELAAASHKLLTDFRHHVLATLRADGSPRVSGTEVAFHGDELTMGSMWQAVKAKDLIRDGRFAVHCNPGDGTLAHGDVKLSGVVREVTDPAERKVFDDIVAAKSEAAAEATGEEQQSPPEPSHLFLMDLHEVSMVTIAETGDHLLIRTWKPGQPITEVKRY